MASLEGSMSIDVIQLIFSVVCDCGLNIQITHTPVRDSVSTFTCASCRRIITETELFSEVGRLAEPPQGDEV